MNISRLERLIEVSIYTNLFHESFPLESGWWSESKSRRNLGSHLFTFEREKTTPETLRAVNKATAEALEWLRIGKYVNEIKTSSKRFQNGIEVTITIDGHIFSKTLPWQDKL